MPKVSVIIPNYNHSKFLPQRIESVLNQTFQDFELILLDDSSPDNSREILEQYRNHPKVSAVIFNEQNSGSTFKQWEKGISYSIGEYIWIAESDDYCESTFLSELVPLLDKHNEVGIAYCQSVSVDEKNLVLYNWQKHTDIFQPNIWKQSFLINGTFAIQNLFIYSNIIPNASGAIFRRSTYNSTSGIDTTMNLVGDWFLWIKMLEANNLLFIARELNYFRQHLDKATNRNTFNFNNLKEWFMLLSYLDKNGHLSKNKKKAITSTIISSWIYQAKNNGIYNSMLNFRKVYEKARLFNKYLWLIAMKIFYIILIKKMFGKKSKNDIIYLELKNQIYLLNIELD